MKTFFFLVLNLLFFFDASAQKDGEVLMTIGKKNITAGEYKYIYEKNNRSDISKKTPDEYMELFTKFKLKVAEAESRQMDTVSKFLTEFEGYKTQLAKPYLTENVKINLLVKEAYERSKTDVKIDIIFLKLPQNPTPADTQSVYKKASDLRSQILSGTSWDTIASKYSDDRGAVRNFGHLPFISSEKIPYSIQNYIFKAEKNDISHPVRSAAGYYIIRKVDERPNPGEIQVAHIMMSVPQGISAEEAEAKKKRIDSIYTALKKGADFAELAKKSDDKGTSQKGGELQSFSTGRMVPEFENAAFGLKTKGEYTQPVKTDFGWHILKLIDKKTMKTFEEAEEELKQIVERDTERQDAVKLYVRGKLKKDFNFREENRPMKMHTMLDSTIFEAKWKAPSAEALTQTLFSINGKPTTEKDFVAYIENNQKRSRKSDLKDYVNQMYEQFITYSLVNAEIAALSEKQPEYRYLMQEYHDGLLLFELMETEVWNKAVEDSVGLNRFFDQNKANYKGQTELKISVFEYGKPKTAEKAVKILKKFKDEDGKTLASKVSTDEAEFKFIESGTYMSGQNKYAEELFNMQKNGDKIKAGEVYNLSNLNALVLTNEVISGRDKSLSEIKGLVISDYQTYLENQWIEKLKAKYPVKINETVFARLKAELK